ncbi:MAG: type II secretion system GspH family protein [Gammaproteobacteria bacterium]|nr:type II secretion system GspH family protein [Gammaproteobacteria bacterium]MBU0828587.1 type II secretion system GspH family protein [Gammaproteobacteria bacterium]MBU0892667.1 type II secretion system GspH family protein [Gammaproteobacteria bacterium]MBU1816715.1 type II secretion system GspH family protein [Gammaproteobacteria bacterium]
MSHDGFRSGAMHACTSQAGFSLIEVAIALVVAGLMSWAAFSGYVTVSEQQEIERGRAEGQQLQSILRAFALRNGRLPCPGTSPDGYETLTGGACSPGNQLGWFPYVSVGLELPTDRLRARYSVFREANLAVPAEDADLAVEFERTGDALGAPTYLDVTDLIVALNNASTKTVTSTRTHLTGDGGAAGAIDCAANRVMVAAYWVVVPLQDKDGDGNRLDAPHTLASLCAASPSAPPRFGSDDVVVAESPAQLAGWLRKSLP